MKIFRSFAASVLLLASLLFALAPARAEDQVLFDFETAGLSNDWAPIRQIQAARQPMPDLPAQEASPPAGFGVRVTTEGNAGLFSQRGKIPGDWRSSEAVALWVYRSAEEAEKHRVSAMEIQIYESDGKTRFWRKVDLDHTGWRRVTVPLRWFHYGDGRVPRWDRADRLGLWFRDAADVAVDNVALVPGKTPNASELTLDDLRQAAFPDAAPQSVRSLESDELRLLTDAEKLDIDRLAAHLKKVIARVRADWPLLKDPAAPAVLIVFADRGAYQAFPDRLARRMDSRGPAPESDGFTMHNTATSYWDDRQGTLRPVYTHELVHSLLMREALIQNRGEWFQEGAANYYQLQFHPQENFSQIVRDGLENEDHRWPLERLLGGEPIPTIRYWQAATVMEMFLTDEKYRPKLGEWLGAIQRAGSTDLEPHLQPILQTDWEGLERDWLDFCRKKYGDE